MLSFFFVLEKKLNFLLTLIDERRDEKAFELRNRVLKMMETNKM